MAYASEGLEQRCACREMRPRRLVSKPHGLREETACVLARPEPSSLNVEMPCLPTLSGDPELALCSECATEAFSRDQRSGVA